MRLTVGRYASRQAFDFGLQRGGKGGIFLFDCGLFIARLGLKPFHFAGEVADAADVGGYFALVLCRLNCGLFDTLFRHFAFPFY